MSSSDFRAHEGKTVLLRFTDGQVVKARVIHVDPDDRNEIIYDLIEIIEPGPRSLPHLARGSTLSAPLASVATIDTVPV